MGWLEVSNEKQTEMAVPSAALLYHAGEVFVYVQGTGDDFTRVSVEVDRPYESGWLLHDGLKAGARVVVVGAQQLLSEELKGKGGEE